MNELYEWLLESAATSLPLEKVLLGLNWTVADVSGEFGFAFSPRHVPRTLDWAGTLRGRSCEQLHSWLLSWNEAEAAVGLAVLNASINTGTSRCLQLAQPLRSDAPGHLRVFAHFGPQLNGQKVVVIGRYPGLDKLWSGFSYKCLERTPQDGDFPDMAAEYLLPQADWVFITASSLANKTLPRLLELSTQAKVVLMGPSMPWLDGWKDFGINYLAGVRVLDAAAAYQVAAEGGGTRLFTGPVEYALLALD
ncbi:DUF364 domain-containing protein [Azomonas macrocytogenes]|uniref:Heavy-metal chelation domain-containing protein n=1 Tax=Azomonas macrocytogenes TaxID=69962 RepID=A0A839T495_AZOMA|nr:DUF364 domain-containing protein [Azomonas macrocytogenes]MBB3103908.1 hypothetical protein [Azomonas macrocytogenes]